MNGNRLSPGIITVGLVAGFLGLWGCGRQEPTEPTPPPQPVLPAVPAGRPVSSDQFFSNWPITTLRITISGTNLESLRQNSRTYVQATLEEGNIILTNLGLHLKGTVDGSFRPLEDKPALTLNSDRFAPGQEFHGVDKFYLNNSVEDASYMFEQLCGQLFQQAGVPAPRVTHARVQLNGTDRGLYVLKEGFDKKFLTRWFKNPDGNLYDAGLVQDITDPLQKDSGDDSTDRADLRALAEAAQEPDLAVRWERLQRLLDMDRFLTFMALEIMTSHTDGYCLNKNNYRVYHDPASDKIVFMPHGMDIMFTLADLSLYPKMEGLVARAVIEIPEARRRYETRVAELLKTVFQLELLNERIRLLQARIRPVLVAMDETLGRSHDLAVEAARLKIARRVRLLQGMIEPAGTNALTFDANGVAPLPAWRPENDYGNHLLDEVTGSDQRPTLHLQAGSDKNCTASWRTNLFLRPGQYRLAGRARASKVVPMRDAKGAGVGLRISGAAQPRTNELAGDAPWSELAYNFVVEPGHQNGEVELVCELRAQEGEAWFDLQSLRLIHLGP